MDLQEHGRLRRKIIAAYESRQARAYCAVRFMIINSRILRMLGLGMQGKVRVLEIGCGFGQFSCYFAARNPQLQFHGIDRDERRIAMAQRAARHLGLENIRFEAGDASGELVLEDQYDVVLMMDLLHHIPDEAKRRLLLTVQARLKPDGKIMIKDISRKPAAKLFFTWVLDVLITRSFNMWYWDERQFRDAVDPVLKMEIHPITHWLPYPHVLYVFSREGHASFGSAAPRRYG